MAIQFYYAPMSSAVRVHWALEELGVPYEGVKIDLAAKEQKKPEFLRINPNGKVPAVVDDGIAYFESVAIFIHLGEKYGVSRGLWPASDSPLRGPAMSWTAWAGVSLGFVAGRLLMNIASSIPDELKHAGQAEQGRKDLGGLFDMLEDRLAGGPYILGEQFSLVDTALGADLWWFTTWTGTDLAKWPRLKAYVERCNERPAYKRVMSAT